jgi:hypothetical protein
VKNPGLQAWGFAAMAIFHHCDFNCDFLASAIRMGKSGHSLPRGPHKFGGYSFRGGTFRGGVKIRGENPASTGAS